MFKNFCVLSVFVAVRILGLPFPGVGAHFFDAVFRFPAEFFFCFGSVGVAGGDVAGAAVSDYVRDFNAGCFFEVLYDIKNAVTFAGAQVVDVESGFVFDFLKGLYVSPGQVYYVDIVSDAGSVGVS